MAQKLTREELTKLDKKQLIAFILKSQKTTPDAPPICNANAPPGFECMTLPDKPPAAAGIMAMQRGNMALKAPPIPKVPPVPVSCDDTSTKKKTVVDPETITGEKRIFVKCERCNKTFIIDLPKKIVLSNPLEVVPVTLLHAEDHALTVYLDQNFESRRDYVSEIYTIEG
jgi:hypothetical protein